MEKKKYQAPKMDILTFGHNCQLLCESCNSEPEDRDYDDEFGLNFGGNNNRHA